MNAFGDSEDHLCCFFLGSHSIHTYPVCPLNYLGRGTFGYVPTTQKVSPRCNSVYHPSAPSCTTYMPASPDPHNTFEVTVPPLFGQDQSFTFTFHLAFPGPVVSSPSLCLYYNTAELIDTRQLKSPWVHVQPPQRIPPSSLPLHMYRLPQLEDRQPHCLSQLVPHQSVFKMCQQGPSSRGGCLPTLSLSLTYSLPLSPQTLPACFLRFSIQKWSLKFHQLMLLTRSQISYPWLSLSWRMKGPPQGSYLKYVLQVGRESQRPSWMTLGISGCVHLSLFRFFSHLTFPDALKVKKGAQLVYKDAGDR